MVVWSRIGLRVVSGFFGLRKWTRSFGGAVVGGLAWRPTTRVFLAVWGRSQVLGNQAERLAATATRDVYRVYKDRGSGLKEDRPGFLRLVRDARAGKFTVIRVTNRDRLPQPGFDYLIMLFAEFDVTIEVLDSRGDSLGEELMDDFMALLASFSGRFYRLRGTRNQRRLLDAAAERLPA